MPPKNSSADSPLKGIVPTSLGSASSLNPFILLVSYRTSYPTHRVGKRDCLKSAYRCRTSTVLLEHVPMRNSPDPNPKPRPEDRLALLRATIHSNPLPLRARYRIDPRRSLGHCHRYSGETRRSHRHECRTSPRRLR